MRRILSVALCAMMLTSVFAINANAAISETYDVYEGATPEAVYLNQDFSNVTEKADFTARNYSGSVSVDDSGVMHMTGAHKGDATMDATSTTAIADGHFVFEFDFRRTGNLDADYRIFATFKRAANKNAADANLKKYGFVAPVDTGHIQKGEWYTYRVTVNEANFNTSNPDPLMKVEYKKKSDSVWTELKHNGGWSMASLTEYKCRKVLGSNAIAWQDPDVEMILGLQSDSWAREGYKFDSSTMDGRIEDVDFSFDNIKVYTPANEGTKTTLPYPINNNGIALTDTAETTKTSSGSTIYYNKSINWAAEPSKIVATFDAVTTVDGGPLSFAAAGKEARSDMVTIKPGEIGKWYSYKIVYNGNAADSKIAIQDVYRKAADESTWTLLNKAPDSVNVSGYDWWNGYNGSGSPNSVRWYLYGGLSGSAANTNSNCAAGTEWKVKNIQITNGEAITGKATVAGSEITVNLNTEFYKASDVIVAVYDGARLKDVSFAPVAITGNKAVVTVPYTEGNTVRVYAWDGLASGVPVLTAPLSITVE